MAMNKSKLSSHVLKMKFMKKSKEKSERDAEEEKRRIFFESELPEEFLKAGDNVIMEPSFVPILNLMNCRLSFGGMNPEIEKLMEEEGLKDLDKLKKMDGISNKEMAERYSTLMSTMQKKSTTKRKWAAASGSAKNDDDDDDDIEGEIHSSKQRPKFQKPKDI